MRVSAFDVGTRNLSYIIAEHNQDGFRIVKWRNLDLVSQARELSCMDLYGTTGKCSGKKKDGTPCNVSKVVAFSPGIVFYDPEKMTMKQITERYGIQVEKGLRKSDAMIRARKKIEDIVATVSDYGNLCSRHYNAAVKELGIHARTFQEVKKKQDSKIKREGYADNVCALYKYLNDDPELFSCDVVLIEKQLKRDMIVLESQIKGFFVMRDIQFEKRTEIVMMHAKLKLCMYDGPALDIPQNLMVKGKQHQRNKFLGVKHAQYIMRKIGGLEEYIDRIDKEKKADDLCDTFLMAAYYIYVQRLKQWRNIPYKDTGPKKKFRKRRFPVKR